MRPRIAVDGRVALHTRTGFGTIAHNVLRRIAAVDTSSSYFFYFDRDPGRAQLEYPAEGYGFGGSSEEIVWCNTFLPRQMKRDRIDVYVTFLDKEVPYFPFSVKVISMIHDVAPIRIPDFFRGFAHKAFYNTLIRASVRRSSLILTNSEFSRQEIASTLSVDLRKIRKLTLGVESTPATNDSVMAAVLERYKVRRPYILALGSATPNKNNETVIRAFRTIADKFPGLSLVIGGKNWLGKKFAPELLDDRINITGFIDDTDLPVLFSAAELFVFPSFHEGFGLPVIEAMEQGVPVITSNVTALPEVGGDAALYVDPRSMPELAAQMERVLSDAGLAHDMKQKGLLRAQSFRWDTTCREIASACRELCDHAK